jgi:DNA repair photolyase
MSENYHKGRGAQVNPNNRFLKQSLGHEHIEGIDEDGTAETRKTKYIEIFPKTIVTKVNSPDLGFMYSMNPYQGCEHGCIYCYARGTHEYYGYSSGRDFEETVLVKKSAPQLLEETFQKKSWKPDLIVLSGNTDCYQPAEQKFEITRKLLEICLKYRHPVGIITKNSLIMRDLDILKQLQDLNLLRVTLSITTLQEDLRSKMEPRTASIKQRLKTLKTLYEAGVLVNVNMAPIIPAINSHEIFELVKTVAEHGANTASYILVRLNGHNGQLFEDWVTKNFPDRADKVLNLIKSTHNGNLSETRFKLRMRGEGNYADQVATMFKLAKTRFLPNVQEGKVNKEIFIRHNQLSLDF